MTWNRFLDAGDHLLEVHAQAVQIIPEQVDRIRRGYGQIQGSWPRGFEDAQQSFAAKSEESYAQLNELVELLGQSLRYLDDYISRNRVASQKISGIFS